MDTPVPPDMCIWPEAVFHGSTGLLVQTKGEFNAITYFIPVFPNLRFGTSTKGRKLNLRGCGIFNRNKKIYYTKFY